MPRWRRLAAPMRCWARCQRCLVPSVPCVAWLGRAQWGGNPMRMARCGVSQPIVPYCIDALAAAAPSPKC
eukprot:2936328-Heterocapsa_arctica.AAC.1